MDDINTNVLDEITNQEIDKLYLWYKKHFSDTTDLWLSFQRALAYVRVIERNIKVDKEICPRKGGSSKVDSIKNSTNQRNC